MKNIIIVSYTLLIAVSLIFGLILEIYPPLNMWLISITLFINGILSYTVSSSNMNKVFKIGLWSTFTFILLIQLLLSAVCSGEIKGNLTLMFYILSFVVQIIIGVTVVNLSKK